MDDPVRLTRDRSAHYRRMALDALRQAEHAASQRQRERWIQLAQNWHAKAVDLEGQKNQPQGDDFYSALASILLRSPEASGNEQPGKR